MRRWLSPDMLVLYIPFAAMLFSVIAAYIWPKTQRILFCLWILAVVAGIFSPTLTVAAWHVRHGNHIVFQGKRFHVPVGWTATVGIGLDFDKSPPSLFPNILGGTAAMILINTSHLTAAGEPTDLRVQVWRRNLQTMNNRFGNSRVLAFLPSGSHDLECVQSLLDVSCLFVQSGLIAEYIGPKSESKAFLEILRSAE